MFGEDTKWSIKGGDGAQVLKERPEFTHVKYHSNAPLLGGLLVLSANIGIDYKGLSGTNALAYYKYS